MFIVAVMKLPTPRYVFPIQTPAQVVREHALYATPPFTYKATPATKREQIHDKGDMNPSGVVFKKPEYPKRSESYPAIWMLQV